MQGIEHNLLHGAPPVKVDAARLVELIKKTAPDAATHWSTRKLFAVVSVAAGTAIRGWQANGLKPRIVHGFKVS